VSAALNRLRSIFDDELFIRQSGEMIPTPRALSLAEPIKEALQRVEAALAGSPHFDPGTMRRDFTVRGVDRGNSRAFRNVCTFRSEWPFAFAPILGLRVYEVPVELAPISLALIWHRRNDEDAGCAWFRQQVIQFAKSLG